MTAQERIAEWAALADIDAKYVPVPWNTVAVAAMTAALTAVLGIPRADVHKADDKEWQRLMSLGYNLALEAAKEAIETALEVTP